MPQPSIPLTVTRGTTVLAETRVDHAVLNMLGAPLVSLEPAGTIGPDFLNMGDIGTALAGSLAPQNFLRRSNFWADEWEKPEGLACAAGVRTENARDFYVESTGAAVNYSRIESAPDGRNSFAAQIIGATGCTSCDFGTWVPAAIAGELRTETLTFSCWVKNLTDAAINITLAVQAAPTLDALSSVTSAGEFAVSSPIAIANGAWQRCSLTFDAGASALFQNGAYLLVRTTNLTSAIKALHFAQWMLAPGSTVVPYVRPTLPAIPKQGAIIYPLLSTKAATDAYELMAQNPATGEIVRYDKPPEFMTKPVVSWDFAIGRPRWIDLDQKKYIFNFTGTDQALTVPAGATSMKIQCWGAGGSNDAATEDGQIKGGVGAYAWGVFACTAGTIYSVVVGEGQHGLNRRPYGFAGLAQSLPGVGGEWNGGGLSGVFTAATTVLETELTRAIIIAGGGGSAGQTGAGANASQGGNGGQPSYSGGQSNFQGADAVLYATGGGGGGWRGGTALARGGKGGTSIVHMTGTSTGSAHALASSGGVDFANTRPATVVPGSTDTAYSGLAGRAGRPGLVVVTFS